jgi:hypothetical protein
MDVFSPIPGTGLADLARQGVESFVTAQKALLDVMTKPRAKPTPQAPHPKPRAGAHRVRVN